MSEQTAVGIDGSFASRVAVDWAMRRAEREDGSVVLLHVAGDTVQSTAERESLVAAELDRVRSSFPGVSVSMEIRTGDPVRALAEESGRFGLLVVGTHKTGFLRGRAFGSTSVRLAATVGAPLAVIPVSSGGARRGVIVGIDDEASSLDVVRYGAREARLADTTLVVIHAHEAPDSSPMGSALALVRNEFPDLVVRTREINGQPSEVLINASATAEVLFIGGGAGVAGLGAVGYDVLLNIAGPTILVPCKLPALLGRRSSAQSETVTPQ